MMWIKKMPVHYLILISFSVVNLQCSESYSNSQKSKSKNADIDENEQIGKTNPEGGSDDNIAQGGRSGSSQNGSDEDADNEKKDGQVDDIMRGGNGADGSSNPVDEDVTGGDATMDGSSNPENEYEPVQSAPKEYLTECTDPIDCKLAPVNCCSCGEINDNNCYAMTTDAYQQYMNDECSEVLCPTKDYAPNPTVFATCLRGTCRVVELLRMSKIVECSSHSDCKLRYSTCCGCGDDFFDRVISISDNSAYEELVCDQNSYCDDCAPTYGNNIVPYCDRGRCRVAIPSGYHH